MTLEKNNPPEKNKFLRYLIAPSTRLYDENDRNLATLLSIFLLTFLSLYLLPKVIHLFIATHTQIEIIHDLGSMIMLGTAYVYARSAIPRVGAWITLIYFSVFPFAVLFVYPERYQGNDVVNSLLWSLPVLVIGLIFLRPSELKWLLFFNLGLYLLYPVLWPGGSYQQISTVLLLGLIIGSLVFLAAMVQRSYLRQAREKAEQSILSEARFREIFFSSPVALLEVDFSAIKERLDTLFKEHGKNLEAHIAAHPEVMQGAASSALLLGANQAALDLYEISDIEVLKKSVHHTSGSSELFSLRDGTIDLWQGKNNNPIEVQQKTLKGNTKNVIVRFAVGVGCEETWGRIIISIVDITKAKEAEASARLLASAVEASASSIVMTDLDGKIEYVNPAFEEKTGYSAAEAFGQNPRILKSDQHSAEFYADMWQTLVSGNAWQGELVNKKKNGELYWETVTISPVRDDTGEVRHYVAVKDDITLVKQADEKIRQQSRFLQTVMDSIASPFYVLNVDDYSIELANEAAKKKGVAEAKTCYALTHKVDAPCSSDEHPCPVKHVLKYKEAFTVEHIHYREDGSPYDVEVHGYPIYDANGNVVQMIEYSLDITARKDAERWAAKLLQEQIVVRKALEAITSSLDIDVVLDRIVTELGEVLNATSAYIWHLNTETNTVTVAAEYFGYEASPKESFRHVEKSYLLSSREFIDAIEEHHYVISQVGDGKVPEEYEQYLREHDVKSVLYIPIQLNGQIIAFVEIRERRRQRDFTPDEIILCQHITQNAAIAISNARNYQQAQFEIQRRKEIERELRKLSNAAEQVASGIVITNTESVIEFANPAAARITGYEINELIGKTTNILKSGKHEPEFYENLWKILRRGETWRGELVNRRKDGSLYWESQVISSVKNSEGEVTHYIAVKEDITLAKEAQDQINTLSNAVQQAAVGIVITDPAGHVEFANPAFTEISGYALDDVIGKTTHELLGSGEHDESFYAGLRESALRGEIWKGEIINRRKDGCLYWEELAVSPVFGAEGVITHFVELKDDISLRKELEQSLALAHNEALVASDMKTQLLANVSHDMRTPLGAILGYTEMLQDGIFEPLNEEQYKIMGSISSSAQRLLDFVINLLNQAQIDTGKIVLNNAFFKPDTLLVSVGSELSFARSKGLQIETSLDESLPETLEGDAYWLGQVLHNLVSNAIKFTPDTGKISIRLYRHDEMHWALCVTDTGKGIPRDAQEYIFESFRQVDGSIQRETHTGSGLGLSIVNHLVGLMEGEITLESELGQGSTFTVILPLSKN